MKKFFWTVPLLVLMLFGHGHNTIRAQSLPLDLKVQWNASIVDATHSAPTGYTLSWNGTVTDVGIPPTDATCNCIQVIRTATVAGNQVAIVTAYNDWGTSAPMSFSVNVSVPNNPSNGRIKK